jgi:hypothetical protein
MLQPLGRTPQDCAEAMCFPCLASSKDVISTLSSSSSSANTPSKAAAESEDWVNSVLVMNPQAQRANVTHLHSEEARQFIWATTVEVLKKAGVSIN